MTSPFEALIGQISKVAADLVNSLRSGETPPALGLRRSARIPVLAALYQELGRPLLLVTERADHALATLDELALWLPDAPLLLFSEPNPLFYENAAWGENTRRNRLISLTRLAGYHIPGIPKPERPPLIITPARAIITRTMSRREFLMATRNLKPGYITQPEELTRTLIEMGYRPANIVVTPGEYARRGGILDLWPPAEAYPTRIEFFGDEVETLRRFDPATQRTVHTIDRLVITPAREFLLPAEREDGEDFSEFHIPLLHNNPAGLLDYLPRQALVILNDREALRETVIEVEEQAEKLRAENILEGTLEASFPQPYISWGEIHDALSAHQTLELGHSVGEEQETGETACSVLGEHFQAEQRFAGRIKPFIEHLAQVYKRGESAIVVSRQTSRLKELWKEQSYLISPQAKLQIESLVQPNGHADGKSAWMPPLLFVQGSLSEGWAFTPLSGPLIHLYSDGEIFGWKRPEIRQHQRVVAETPESAYADLQAGDWVVHVDHGIGHFVGLFDRVIDGIEREYLCIEYADQAQLFVPVHQADRLTRYVGADGSQPTPSRLGGTEWRTVKGLVKEAVQEVAQELLELYATRRLVKGFAFSADNTWQQELEASFPYVETEDQVRVLGEVKTDMEIERPMDRLICGDVGYGKTEVALRAAFKAVMDGKQVAMLVPTTVLAQQHYDTFRQRLAAFPVEVEMLSRFRTQQQQREILRRTALGSVDILIGTHRLFSPDVKFKDLGLLIIDEEQRFGVTHKETLKKLRTEVDVITLTATPIPRTLYMALTGVRDISMINTPPEERLPIITHVGPYSPRLVRQAIVRELERGGQVFFVHNRVQTIGAMHHHLQNLAPEARIAIAHGQMPENELSDVMKKFSDGEVDVLLTTSIIESGLDIPNANTLIVDRADTFGLGQLYQLRGRVGRGAQRAYAYFFRHARRPPTLDGRQRLETIAENTQLGTGFSIAMRDLEIRGAGEILGTRQHGHIASVGFHLYTQLLTDAVRRLSKEKEIPEAIAAEKALAAEAAIPVNVDLPLAVSIPVDYVADKNMRLRLYRRMADIRSMGEVDALVEEFIDRFGPLPEAVRNLLFQLKIKLMAEKAGLASISGEDGQLIFRFPDGTVPTSLPDLGPYVRIGKTALWFVYSEQPNWPEILVQIVERLGYKQSPLQSAAAHLKRGQNQENP